MLRKYKTKFVSLIITFEVITQRVITRVEDERDGEGVVLSANISSSLVQVGEVSSLQVRRDIISNVVQERLGARSSVQATCKYLVKRPDVLRASPHMA